MQYMQGSRLHQENDNICKAKFPACEQHVCSLSLLGLEIEIHRYRNTETQIQKCLACKEHVCRQSARPRLLLASTANSLRQTASRPYVCAYIRYSHMYCHTMYKYELMQVQSPNKLDNNIPLPMFM